MDYRPERLCMNQLKKNTMKELPLSERPYELLESKGENALTDAQLLAILLKSGTTGETALELAIRLLSSPQEQGIDPLVALCHRPLRVLKEHHGIGRVKAIQLKAVCELAKRISSKKAKQRLCIEDPASLVQIYMEEMRYLSQEVIKAVYFNTKMELLGDRNLSYGTINQSLITPREVFTAAWELGAYSFILLHNHPSGNPEPSMNDILLTDRLRQAAKLVEIPMQDHIILGDGCYYSFKEHHNKLTKKKSERC